MNRLDLIINGNQIRALDVHAKPQTGFKYFSARHDGELEITEVVKEPSKDLYYRFKWSSGYHAGKADSAGKEFFESQNLRRIG